MYRLPGFKLLYRPSLLVLTLSAGLLLAACSSSSPNSQAPPPQLTPFNPASIQPTPTLKNVRAFQEDRVDQEDTVNQEGTVDQEDTADPSQDSTPADRVDVALSQPAQVVREQSPPHPTPQAETTVSLPIVAEPVDVHINSFTVTPGLAAEGDTLTASWDVSGVDAVMLAMSYYGEPRQYGPPQTVAPKGATTFTAPDGTREVEFILWTDTGIRQVVTVSLNCRFAWFNANASDHYCPETEAQPIQTVYQPFTGGYMILRQNSDMADGDMIWFYFSDDHSSYVMPEWVAVSDEPFTDLPPEGLFRPVNSFGRIWEGSPHIRNRLGWALAEEQIYAMTYQQTPWSVGTKGSRYRLFTLPDGQVIGADISSW